MVSPLENAKSSYNPKRPSAYYTKVKKNSNGELDELLKITSFLNSHYIDITVNQRLHHYLRDEMFVYVCPICVGALEYRVNPNPNYKKTCGAVDCNKKFNYTATANTIKQKYGFGNISQTEYWKNKVKDTNIKKYGVEWNTQSIKLLEARKQSWVDNKEKQIERRKATNIKKYGTAHALQNESVKEKLKKSLRESRIFRFDRVANIKLTNLNKYGKEWYTETDAFKNKAKITLLNNYDVTHNSKLSSVLDKRWNNTCKKYTMPSGKIIHIQGYEDKCITELLSLGYDECDIVTGNANIEELVGKFLYIGADSKSHRYYPDIYIKSENKIIEVKSKYTLSKDTEINSKKKSVLERDMEYELKIYD